MNHPMPDYETALHRFNTVAPSASHTLRLWISGGIGMSYLQALKLDTTGQVHVLRQDYVVPIPFTQRILQVPKASIRSIQNVLQWVQCTNHRPSTEIPPAVPDSVTGHLTLNFSGIATTYPFATTMHGLLYTSGGLPSRWDALILRLVEMGEWALFAEDEVLTDANWQQYLLIEGDS